MRDLTCPEMSDQTPTAPVATRYVHRARHHPAWVEDVDRMAWGLNSFNRLLGYITLSYIRKP